MDELTQVPCDRFLSGEAVDGPEHWRAASIAHDPIRPLDLFLLMIWFGLLTGLLEAGLVLAHRSLFDRISLESLRHEPPFRLDDSDRRRAPLRSCRSRFRVAGQEVCGWAHKLACTIAIAWLALSVLWTVEWLHSMAGLVVACAVAVRAVPGLWALTPRLLPIVRASTPIMAGGLIVLACLVSWSVSSAEQSAWASLPAGSVTRPNVLLIVMDNVRAESLSLYGYNRPTTPRLTSWHEPRFASTRRVRRPLGLSLHTPACSRVNGRIGSPLTGFAVWTRPIPRLPNTSPGRATRQPDL